MGKEIEGQSSEMTRSKSHLEGVPGGYKTRPQVSGLLASFIPAVPDFLGCPPGALG